jgi:transposase
MAAAQSDIGAHRGTPTSHAELEGVAQAYLEAWGIGLPVTEAVADHFKVSKSTASKRIMKARAAGLLDEAKRITR